MANRIIAALGIGLLGCLLIWVATPYNNFFLNNSYLADTYFPVVAVIFMLLLVLGVNPILSSVNREWVLDRRQLALIFVMLLAATVVASSGLLRMLPWSLARTTVDINRSAPLAQAFARTGVPPVLFPDAIGYDVATPASEQFLDELAPGASIPWRNWLRLLPVWGVFLLSCWLVMIGVGLVLFPEWRENERLPFPLLEVYRSLLPEATSARVLPAVFRERLFWVGAGVVMFLYALNGLNYHTHGRFPGFPLGWNLSEVFTEVPWRYLPATIKSVNHIYFFLVGMAFFMPNRVGFSIWSVTIAYGLYEMFAVAYLPTHYRGAVHDHRNGAMIAVALAVLYLSRNHWRTVGRLMCARAATDGDRLLKLSGWMLATGAAGMFLWLVWAGVSSLLAVALVGIGFLVSLLVARIVAETGLPFIRIVGLEPAYLMALLPARWLSGAAIYLAGVINLIFNLGSRVSATVMVSHAVGVDEKATARQQLWIGYLMLALLVIGLVVCGMVHLHMGYTRAYALDGGNQPLNPWGAAQLAAAQNNLLRWASNSWPWPSHRLGNLGFGLVLAGALQFACMISPRWPIHPIGLLLVGSWYGQMAWASVLIGWGIKVLLVNFGGAAAFRRARPLFLGIIMGEVFSVIIWTLVPVGLLWLGHDPADVGHIAILPQ